MREGDCQGGGFTTEGKESTEGEGGYFIAMTLESVRNGTEARVSRRGAGTTV